MKRSIALILSFIFFSCNSPKDKSENDLQKLNWLLGNWENKSDSNYFYETWEMSGDTALIGVGGGVKNKDTVFSETMVLKMVNGILNYIPTVKNQNEGNAIYFPVVKFLDSVIVFANSKHDFPQEIKYILVTKDSIYTRLFGIMDGGIAEDNMGFKRVH